MYFSVSHFKHYFRIGVFTMDKDEFKLPKTAAELFASHVVEERQDPAGLRKAVVKVLGMTQVTLKEAT